MEYLQVFDANSNMLDEKVERNSKFDLPDGKFFMVVLIFMQNEKGEFLLQKAVPEKDSLIATTGGHVTYGDTSLETAIKECKEELGIEFASEELKFVGTEVWKKCCLMDIYYTNKPININDITLQKEEVEYAKWFSVDEIEQMINNDEIRKGNIIPFHRTLEFIKNK
jgi:NADH pyrophosphatase NudC (nudix superfamily)